MWFRLLTFCITASTCINIVRPSLSFIIFNITHKVVQCNLQTLLNYRQSIAYIYRHIRQYLPELDMGRVHPWVGLGWVGLGWVEILNFGWVVLGWVGSQFMGQVTSVYISIAQCRKKMPRLRSVPVWFPSPTCEMETRHPLQNRMLLLGCGVKMNWLAIRPYAYQLPVAVHWNTGMLEELSWRISNTVRSSTHSPFHIRQLGSGGTRFFFCCGTDYNRSPFTPFCRQSWEHWTGLLGFESRTCGGHAGYVLRWLDMDFSALHWTHFVWRYSKNNNMNDRMYSIKTNVYKHFKSYNVYR